MEWRATVREAHDPQGAGPGRLCLRESASGKALRERLSGGGAG